MRFRNSLPAQLALTLGADPAGAVDGVLEINQTCAVQTGCFPGDTAGFPGDTAGFPGDTAGFPVSIDATTPGTSFRLTSDLVIPDTNPAGIVTGFVRDVSIDLNQFSIIRAACKATPSVACRPSSGPSHGIQAAFPGASVRNGSVVGIAATE